MPWSKVRDHADCPAGEPWAVVSDETDEVEGCHETEADADAQVAALYDAEVEKPGDGENMGGRPSEGTPKDRRLKRNKKSEKTTYDDGQAEVLADGEDESAVETAADARWVGVLIVEGVVTGDQREFAEGSLTWADPPLTLRWNIEESHGGVPTTKAVDVGNITEVWRDGGRIMGRGEFDLGSDQGREAHRRVSEGFLRGVSVDADDITDADVELVWPEDGPEPAGESDDPLDRLFASPEKVIFKKGRIRAATLCAIPAFVEAYIQLDGGAGAGETDAAPLAAAAVGSHDTVTSDGAWDAAAHQGRLPSPVPLGAARATYAWIEDGAAEDGAVPKSACKFPHHEVGADGAPGAANLTACSAGIAALNGARGGAKIPPDQRRGVYGHLAAHLRDADREPPPLRAEAEDVLAAAAVVALDERRPPRAWFENPRLTVPVGITVSDEGRVYGHAAQWGECHVGYPDACVTAPYEDDHPYFLTGEVVCADGSRVAVGQITVGAGHAPLAYGASRAAEHYDNTGAAVADVAVGNDDVGIWVAGAIRPHAEAARVHDLRAAGRVSGDWRRIGGQLRLVGLLGVNVAGFMPRVAARVASGVQTALVAAGHVAAGPPHVTEEELARRALRIVMQQLAARVHPPAGESHQT